ncbi:MAG: peptide chain release factor N(5)-glutamine methyltransferase [Actinobacteria bacterium QS_8_72_14]|nr:MAG: peptide chain release factor N(5)-glutamine methyltransferase [Actinobacteria bacterium QS_8_72_14]
MTGHAGGSAEPPDTGGVGGATRQAARWATVGDARAHVTGRLAAAGVEPCEVDADLLIASVCGWTRPRVALERDTPLKAGTAAAIGALADRRAAREPLQRLLGEIGFRRLRLRVCDDVLVPRPETEVLAGLAIEATPPEGTVVDVGTGTGAVALAVADEASPGLVVATDVSEAAVACAADNAQRRGLAVNVRLGDLLEAVPEQLRGEVDVLVSNPPYLTPEEVAAAAPEVAEHESREALVGGAGGQDVIWRLLAAAGQWLAPGGTVLVEGATTRLAAAAERAKQLGLRGVGVQRDLAGRERVLVARR